MHNTEWQTCPRCEAPLSKDNNAYAFAGHAMHHIFACDSCIDDWLDEHMFEVEEPDELTEAEMVDLDEAIMGDREFERWRDEG